MVVGVTKVVRVSDHPPVETENTKTADHPIDCGLIMPIAEWDGCSPAHWVEVNGIVSTALAPTYRARLVSASNESSVIPARIVTNVYNDKVAVCDVSGRNPNVMFELGLRLAFDRPVVIIKDDATPFSFDTQMIEHVQYPRTLRHGAVEKFMTDLRAKVDHALNATGPTFLQTLRHITVKKLEEQSQTPQEALLSSMQDLQMQVSEIRRATVPRRRGLTGNAQVVSGENVALLRKFLAGFQQKAEIDALRLGAHARFGELLPANVVEREVWRADEERRLARNLADLDLDSYAENEASS